MEVKWEWSGKSQAFYIENHNFSVSEVKMLIDAVQAADFISDEQTAELEDKLAFLGGIHRSSILKSNLVHFNTKKQKISGIKTSENVHYNVDAYKKIDELKNAIQVKKSLFSSILIWASIKKKYTVRTDNILWWSL